jgi:hypothetical protein
MTNKCGTAAGHTAHRRAGQIPCDPCREAYNVSMREWKLKNRTRVLADKKAYREANLDKIIGYRKKYQIENSEILAEKRRRWRQENPEKFRQLSNAYDRKRRARKFNNGYSPYTLEQVLEEYGSICYLCEKPIDLTASRKAGVGNWQKGLHLDHAIPLSKGGMDCLDNVAPTHAICNLSKGPNHF